MIRFIAAIDNKMGLANEHGIPWQGKIPTDVAYFRDMTIGSTVMMGAGWYKEQQKPLINKRNIVATRNPEPLRPGFERAEDARKFLKKFKAVKTSQVDTVRGSDIWVGGGAGLFASTLDLADELYLTRIDADFDCTKFFPDFEDEFELKSSSDPITENGVTYHFETWSRKLG